MEEAGNGSENLATAGEYGLASSLGRVRVTLQRAQYFFHAVAVGVAMSRRSPRCENFPAEVERGIEEGDRRSCNGFPRGGADGQTDHN